nr:hypothetical protein Iba_scaffold150CG0840 [Ipomoea batatas]
MIPFTLLITSATVFLQFGAEALAVTLFSEPTKSPTVLAFQEAKHVINNEAFEDPEELVPMLYNFKLFQLLILLCHINNIVHIISFGSFVTKTSRTARTCAIMVTKWRVHSSLSSIAKAVMVSGPPKWSKRNGAQRAAMALSSLNAPQEEEDSSILLSLLMRAMPNVAI